MMKRFLTVFAVIAIIAGSWILYTLDTDTEPTVPEGIVTVAVTRGDIEAIISATGSLAAERSEPITFGASGEVVEVLAFEGDTVKADQVLARLDTEDLELSLKQAEASLAISKAQLRRARKGPSKAEIASAEAAVVSAKANLEGLQSGPKYRQKELARLAIDQAKNSLYGAQGNRDATKGQRFASGGAITQAEAAVLNAELAVKIAEIQYEQLFEPAEASAIVAAESQIVQAESALQQLLDLPSAEDIAISEAQVAQNEVAVEIARKRVEDAVLTAPFGGTLASWELHRNDWVTPGNPVGVLVDNSRYHIDVSIDETEISSVFEGQTVRIELDAFPDETLIGRVSEIDLVGNNTQGIVNYVARVALARTDLPIRPLMTAAVDIVIDQREDVLLVPNRAVKRDKDGKYVEYLDGVLPKKRYIEAGVRDDAYTEVLSGLEEGQEVITTKPRESMFGGG